MGVRYVAAAALAIRSTAAVQTALFALQARALGAANSLSATALMTSP